MSARVGLGLLCLLACGACSGSKETLPSASTDAGDIEGSADCSADSRVAPYKAGMKVDGSTGKLTFVLTGATPSPPAQGMNAWTMQVGPKGGAPSTGYKLAAAPYMPDHGHGPSTNPNVAVQDGAYLVSQIDFFMGGVWRVTATASDGNNTPVDSANFFFCVP